MLRVRSVPFSSSVPTFKQADPGLRHAEDLLGVDRAHDAVLVEVFGLGVHVGADVDDDDRAPGARGRSRRSRAGGRPGGTSWR